MLRAWLRRGIAPVGLLVAGATCLPVRRGQSQSCWKTDSQIADFRFDMPHGWKRIESNGISMLVPGDLSKGAVAHIGLLPAQRLSGDLRSWFDARWTEWQQQFHAIDGYNPSADRTSEGFNELRVYSRITSPALGSGAFVFAAVQVGPRIEAYYFVDNTGSYSHLEDDLPSFEHSLRFADRPSHHEADDPSGGTGGLDGLYIGYRMRGATPSEQTHFEYFAFFPDGNVIRFLPPAGLQDFDFAAEVKKSRDYCGCYRVHDGKVSIVWGDNSTETAQRSADSAGALKIQGDSYFPISKSDGLTLDGEYRREGEDLARSAFRFTPEGRFHENGMLTLVAYDGANLSPGRGSYQIGKNTLTLHYDDGRTIALSFYVWPDELGPRPGAIHVNTYRLVRAR